MHIAYVTESDLPDAGGTAHVTARTLAHLREAGHSVQWVRPRQPGEAPRDDATEWRTPAMALPGWPPRRIGWATPGALRRHWQSSAPDLVHAATAGPLAWAALAAARAEGIATTADFRARVPAPGPGGAAAWLAPLRLQVLRRLYAWADCCFVPSTALADDLAALGFGPLQVVDRGVDARLFTPQRHDAALRVFELRLRAVVAQRARRRAVTAGAPA